MLALDAEPVERQFHAAIRSVRRGVQVTRRGYQSAAQRSIIRGTLDVRSGCGYISSCICRRVFRRILPPTAQRFI